MSTRSHKVLPFTPHRTRTCLGCHLREAESDLVLCWACYIDDLENQQLQQRYADLWRSLPRREGTFADEEAMRRQRSLWNRSGGLLAITASVSLMGWLFYAIGSGLLRWLATR